MEVLKQQGKPDKILIKQKTLEWWQLSSNIRKYANLFKITSTGKKLFEVPFLQLPQGERFFYPKKVNCDIVINDDREIEAVTIRSVLDQEKIISIEEWEEKIQEKVQRYQDLQKQIQTSNLKNSPLIIEKYEIEKELDKTTLMQVC